MDVTHTFPLPEAESGKLSAVAEELSHQPLLYRLTGSVRANVWPLLALSLAAGFCIGELLGQRFTASRSPHQRK